MNTQKRAVLTSLLWIMLSHLVPTGLLFVFCWKPTLDSNWTNFWIDDRYLYVKNADIYANKGMYADDSAELDATRSRMPGYPILLLILRGMAIHTGLSVDGLGIAFNLVFMIFSAIIWYRVLEHWGFERIGFYSALLWPWIPGVLPYSLAPMPEAFACLLWMMAIFQYLGPRPKGFRSGLILSLAVLTKPIFLLWIGPHLLLGWVIHRENWKRKLLHAMLLLIAFAIPLAGWMYRNHQIWNVWTLTPNGAGHICSARDKLWQKLGRDYSDAYLEYTPDFAQKHGFEYDNLAARSEVNRKRAVADLQQEKGAFVQLCIEALVQVHLGTGTGALEKYCLNAAPPGLSPSRAMERSTIWQGIQYGQLAFLLLVYLGALVGVYFSLRDQNMRFLLLFALLIYGYFVFFSLPYGHTRYRFQALPALSLLFCMGVSRLSSGKMPVSAFLTKD